MIFDCETDGLLDVATKIHVLSYHTPEGVKSTHDYEEMRTILTEAKLLVGHNIVCFDIPALEKILEIKIKARLIDTLALSWYLNFKRVLHGLDSYGKDYGIPKPKIDNWENLTPEEYRHRCEEDVKINQALWKDLQKKLMSIYKDKSEAKRLITYLTFKMECLREQERSGWLLDKALAEKSVGSLEEQEQEKILELMKVMPQIVKTRDMTAPPKPFKKDGTLSVAGAKWASLLKDRGLPKDYEGPVEVVVATEEPNPGSSDQVKAWLSSLGWKPESFKFAKEADGSERKIPQVRVDGEDGKELCPSVKKLCDKHPEINVLDGLTVIQHRLSIFRGFLKNEKGGRLVASAAGLTNTLRFKHRILVNLPGVDKAWGKEIRGCLIADEGEILCGSDMVSLEETTKKHYMFPYDPDFVAEMSKEGFDAHLDLAKHAKAVTQQEIDDYIGKAIGAKNLKPLRKNYKAANYSL
jgi:hypothetical protein